MTTAGTYHYQPSAGTGNLLLSNPPFAMGNPRPSHLNDYLTYALHMDINQPTTAKGLPKLTEAEFLRLSAAAGGNGHPFWACNYDHALRIAQLAFTAGADLELEVCCEWLNDTHYLTTAAKRLRDARRPKPPTLKEQALAILDDCSGRGIDAAHWNALRRVLEALPE